MPTKLNKDSQLDPFYDQTLNMLVKGELKNSVTAVQYHFRIGYNRAANLLEQIRTRINKEVI
ncbi:DNA translocase FtsK [Serratia fonticola]|uniref:DNA translocase FtsK n=1 Tax=Serratia fonticola TaxID=47917 RepID=UPI00218315E5|nr:DNA translocase FtsK [Serratia fonticola]CAI2158666.1 DNA translocase FtsK [Serratia fonticola]